ncbi:hypothetical protein FPCIR_11583 [Fusarium pseudocircinatum]|uniref:Uncharacterized protein n=1 Tax=Fusarium pseudocircinatum TaxID=56676 RepID=A0A8H5NVD3_9HYPO|nr:hypothetical protein FPCIR_11583 [Fusarium pseudocircinatum]
MPDKKHNTRKRKRSASAGTPTILVIQFSCPRPVDKSGEKAAKTVKTSEIKTVESKTERKGGKSLAATSTRLSESDRKALTASKRAMFAAVSSKGNGSKTRTTLNSQRDLIQECDNEGIVKIISSGTPYMAMLYDSAGLAVAIPPRPPWRIRRLAKQPAKQR